MKNIFQNLHKVLIAAIVIYSYFFTFSQAQELRFGPKAGLTVSDITNVITPGSPFQTPTNPVFGFHGGVVVDIAINDHLSIAPEVLFSTAGAKQSTDETTKYSQLGYDYTLSLTGTDYINLNYLQLPIMLKHKSDKGIYMSFGPTLGYLLSAKYTDASILKTTTVFNNVTTSGSVATDTAYRIDTAFKKLDIGIAFGCGYQFEFGLGFGIRYVIGISDIFKGGVTYPDVSSPYYRTITQGSYGKNEIFQFSISYLFGGSK